MNLFYCAFLYVTRKHTKSLLLFLILLVISTLVLSGIAIKDATETAALNVRQALGGIFTLQQNTSDSSKWVSIPVGNQGTQSYYGGEPLTVELAEHIMSATKGISGYNATYTNYTVPLNSDGKILELLESDDDGNNLDALMAGSGDFNSTVSTIAATNTAYDSYFKGGYIELVEGKHFTTADESPAIISSELAELNSLHVGDKITLRMSEYKASMMGLDVDKTNAEVTIVGLFRSTAKSTTSFSNWSMDNSIFTTLEVVKNARPDMGDESFERIQFYVNDPGEIDNIIRDVKKLPNLDPTDFVVSVDSSNVDAVMEPLTNMSHLISILILLVLVVGAAILCLVLSIRMKDRMHESGIKLALGLTKRNIVAQYLIEVFIIAIFAFGLSVLASSYVTKNVGNQLLDYTIYDRAQTSTSETPGTSIDGETFLGSSDFAPEFEGGTSLTKIEVKIEPMMIIGMFGVGFLIICAAVMFASTPVLRMKPREILAKMS